MKIITILGTRPEIIKLSPLLPLLEKEFEHVLVHTGQHYDYNMDKAFFEELNLPLPKYLFNAGSHSQGKQTALMLEKTEEILYEEKPDLVIVLGDTNTTLAGALAAVKLHFPVMHIEAGCRSFNRKMPEEINRIVTDHISDYLVAPDENSYNNLISEGIQKEKIFLLGSTMFDAVERNKHFIKQENILNIFGLKKERFILVTLHRAENTGLEELQKIIAALNDLSSLITLIFPIHPRTKKVIEENKIQINERIKIIEPQPYLSFLALLSSCKFCITDSGGIQEEALFFNQPCLILRNETEWIRLVNAGKNILLSTDPEMIVSVARDLIINEQKLQHIKNKYYPIKTNVSEQIIQILKKLVNKQFLEKNQLPDN